MSRGLEDNITSITPLGDAIDGTPREPQRRRGRVRRIRAEPTDAWCCPACGARTGDAAEHASHMTGEWIALRGLIRSVRDLLGAEPPEWEFIDNGPDRIDTVDAGRLLNVSAARVRQLIAEGQLVNVRRVGRAWLLDRVEVQRLVELRQGQRSARA